MTKMSALERQAETDRLARRRIVREKEEQEARVARAAQKWEEDQTAKCGTVRGHNKHVREGTNCKPCAEANRAAQRKADQRKRAKQKTAAEAANKN